MSSLLSAFHDNQDGTTAVEFALIAGAFLMIVFGIFESGRAFLTWNSFQAALEDATRYALVHDTVTAEEITERIANNLTGMTLDDDRMTITVSSYTLSGVDFYEVDGTYEFETVAPLLPADWATFDLSANSRLPVP